MKIVIHFIFTTSTTIHLHRFVDKWVTILKLFQIQGEESRARVLQQVGLVEIFNKSFAKRVKLQKLQRFRARSTIIVSRVGIANKKGIT